MNPRRPSLAPEGASCEHHPERPALATCPRCGSYVCLECWHEPVERCVSCLARAPESAAPPVPWEDRGRGAVTRLFGTFSHALHPARGAPAFARPSVAPAVRFALLFALPLAMLRGVVPYTKLLLFGAGFSLTVVGQPTREALALDVAQAAAFGALVNAVGLLALAAPYVSLSSVYGNERARAASLRVMFYRAWLLPMCIGGIPFWLVSWGLPREPTPFVVQLIHLLDVLPLVLVTSSMWHTARLASGITIAKSLLVVFMPIAVFFLAGPLVLYAISPLLPASMTAAAAAQ